MRKDYQRKYLRAPFRDEVLFSDEGFVFKGKGLNISQGGILLEHIGHIPVEGQNHFLVYLPEFPLFKNYSLAKILSFNRENFLGDLVRFSAEMVRKDHGLESCEEGVFRTRIAFEFTNIAKMNLIKLSKYIDTYSSNLIFLQLLLDSVSSDKDNLMKLRKVSSYLGYAPEEKLAILRKQIERDYKSLQWL